ncbi:MAG TPA: hypothetical protein VFD82_07845 [Planctomycetota bacterium]|nr:hypothetical protein [Planctomycetota bacterium]
MQDIDFQTFSLTLPKVLPPGKTALAINLERTRSVVVGASVKPSAPQAKPVGLWIRNERGDLSVVAERSLEIKIDGDLTPGDTLELRVDFVGEPVGIHNWILLERRARPAERRKTKSMDGGDAHALDAIAVDRARTTDARISEPRPPVDKTKTTLAGIRERRKEVLADENDPLSPHRLFFLQVDEWTDITCLPRAPSNGGTLLPKKIKVRERDVVLEALHPRTLGYELKLWTKQMARGEPERDLGDSPKDYKFRPTEWAAAMSQYLKAVMEYGFERYFHHPVLKPGGVVDEDFRTAFEAFANGQLGKPNGQGLPESAILWPNSAYYFSFAAFAHVATQFAKDDDEKRFWAAVLPVFVYTSDIYRRRFAPPNGHREYKDYNLAHINGEVDKAVIEKLRNVPANMDSLRQILQEAFHGHP